MELAGDVSSQAQTIVTRRQFPRCRSVLTVSAVQRLTVHQKSRRPSNVQVMLGLFVSVSMTTRAVEATAKT